MRYLSIEHITKTLLSSAAGYREKSRLFHKAAQNSSVASKGKYFRLSQEYGIRAEVIEEIRKLLENEKE